ncbi:MAG: efflux RND transporter permease subunit, partial [Bacteroidetes bacterium]|nr:efflux RND transporter permease subunit [Fibrella sp.]
KYSLADLPVLRVAVTSRLADQALGTLLTNQIKPRLAQVKGVGQVNFVGLAQTEVAIALDARRLEERRLSILQITEALSQANLNVPAGTIKDQDALYSVRVVGKTDEVSRLADVVVAVGQAGQKIRLGELATIQTQAKDPENVNRYNGRPSVGMLLTKQSGANNVEVSQSVRAEMQKLQTEFSASGLRFDVAQDGSEFTLAAADAVNHDLMLAVGLVALVMFVFLHSLRSSLIVLVAIPASLLSTFVFMSVLGFSLNLLTLLALSLVVGILVDDSIVVLESIYQQLEKGREKRQAALDGRNAIGFAAVAITLVDVVVFLPLSVAPGLIGDLMREFALVVVIATLFSLLVSFTLTPMIASRFGKLEHLTRASLTGRFGLWFEGYYEQLSGRYRNGLAWALGHRKTVAFIVGSLFVGAMLLPTLGFVGSEFTAPADKGEIQVIAQLPDGAKLEQTDAVANRLETALRRMPEITNVFVNVGANPDGFPGVPTTNTAELNITFKPRQERSRDLAQLSRQVKEIIAQESGLRVRVSPIGLLGSDAAQPIIVIVSGADRTEVQRQARRIADVSQTIPGMADVRLSGESRKPEVQVAIDREKLARYGLMTQDVGLAVRTALAGFDELKIQQENNAVTVRVRLAETDRNRTAQLRRLTLMTPSGQPVALAQVADVREAFMPAVLERQDRSNAVTLYAQVIGRPVGDIGADLKQAVTGLNLPPAVRVTYGGDLELQDDSFGKLGLVFGAAILFMYLIMVALYNSWLYPFVVLFSIPVAVVGALLALALTMNSLNVFSLLGMIMMLGLVAKNAILLVERANENRAAGMPLTEALLDAGQTRLRPILMTTLAMVIGMLPIALASGPGAELKTGLAWALIGGLSSSMFLTLLFVPAMYADLTRLSEWAANLLNRAKPVTRPASSAATALLIGTLYLLGNTPPTLAQSPPAPLRLSLADALALVDGQNPAVKLARFDTRRAELKLTEAQRATYPTLNGLAQYTHNIKPPVFFLPGLGALTGGLTGTPAPAGEESTQALAAALKNVYVGAINLAMPLYQPDLKIGRQLARNGIQQASENERSALAGQRLTIKKAYYNLLLLAEQRRLARQNLARNEEALREARNLLRAQMATDADTLRAFVAVENGRPTLSKLDRDAVLLRQALLLPLGLAANTELALTDSLHIEPSPTDNGDEQGGGEQAMAQRPDVRQLTLALESSRQQADLERIRRLPTVALFGQFSTTAQMDDFRLFRAKWPLTLYAGLQVTIPLINPTTTPRVQQARLATQQADGQLRYAKQQIEQEVRGTRYATQEARERLAMQARTIAAAERSYGLVRSRYRQGMAKWSEVADAELALEQAQTNRMQAIYDLLIARADLDKATGN